MLSGLVCAVFPPTSVQNKSNLRQKTTTALAVGAAVAVAASTVMPAPAQGATRSDYWWHAWGGDNGAGGAATPAIAGNTYSRYGCRSWGGRCGAGCWWGNFWGTWFSWCSTLHWQSNSRTWCNPSLWTGWAGCGSWTGGTWITPNQNNDSKEISGAWCDNGYWSGYGCWRSASHTIAQWAIGYWIISYNANGGSGAPGAQWAWRGESIATTWARPTRTGYNFNGYFTAASGGSNVWTSTQQYNTSKTLYAQWTIQTWTVSYNANGGSGAPGNQTKTYGSTLWLSGTKPTRSSSATLNYSFKCWNTNSSGTGTNYSPGGAYTANAGVTLYAIWNSTPRTSAVTLNQNGGSGGTTSVTATYGSAMPGITKPTYTGRTFGGYYGNW